MMANLDVETKQCNLGNWSIPVSLLMFLTCLCVRISIPHEMRPEEQAQKSILMTYGYLDLGCASNPSLQRNQPLLTISSD